MLVSSEFLILVFEEYASFFRELFYKFGEYSSNWDNLIWRICIGWSIAFEECVCTPAYVLIKLLRDHNLKNYTSWFEQQIQYNVSMNQISNTKLELTSKGESIR